MGQVFHKIEHQAEAVGGGEVGLVEAVEVVEVVLPEFAVRGAVPVGFFGKNLLHMEEAEAVFMGPPSRIGRDKFLKVKRYDSGRLLCQRVAVARESSPFFPQKIKNPVADLHRMEVAEGVKIAQSNADCQW